MLRNTYRHKGLVVALLVGMCGLTAPLGRVQGQPGEKMPSGAKLMDNFIKATGGKEAYAKVKTAIIKGTFSMPAAGVKGDMTIHIKAPKLMHFGLALPGIGNIEAGYDGKVFWENNPITGPKITNSSQQKDLMPGLDFSSDVNWREAYKSAKNDGDEMINGKDAWRVKLVDKKGETETRFFDKATGLVLKIRKPMKSELGNFTMDMDVGDFKKVGALTMPHSFSASVLNQKIEARLSSIQTNVEVPDSKFALPEAVKELLKKQKDQPKDSGK